MVYVLGLILKHAPAYLLCLPMLLRLLATVSEVACHCFTNLLDTMAANTTAKIYDLSIKPTLNAVNV